MSTSTCTITQLMYTQLRRHREARSYRFNRIHVDLAILDAADAVECHSHLCESP